MAGCSGGTVAVTLRHSETNKILATVTVTVLDRPVIERYEEMAYRWFHIYWRGPADYTSYRVEWYDTDTSRWKPLSNAASGPRAILYTASAGASTRAPQPSPLPGTPTHADVRGIEYNSQTKVRVVGSTFDNVSGTSAEFTVTLSQPDALGHLPDHTAVYQWARFSDDEPDLEGWIDDVVSLAANGWADLRSSLKACLIACTENQDNDLVRLRINANDCGGKHVVACVTTIAPDNVDTEFTSNRYMTFTPIPKIDQTTFIWTDNQSFHGDRVDENDPSRVYLWVGAVVLHEFGHVFGIKDYGKYELQYTGIMNTNYLLYRMVSTLGSSDIQALEAIYKGNRPNLGW